MFSFYENSLSVMLFWGYLHESKAFIWEKGIRVPLWVFGGSEEGMEGSEPILFIHRTEKKNPAYCPY